jgi:hypothetical protein
VWHRLLGPPKQRNEAVAKDGEAILQAALRVTLNLNQTLQEAALSQRLARKRRAASYTMTVLKDQLRLRPSCTRPSRVTRDLFRWVSLERTAYT